MSGDRFRGRACDSPVRNGKRRQVPHSNIAPESLFGKGQGWARRSYICFSLMGTTASLQAVSWGPATSAALSSRAAASSWAASHRVCLATCERRSAPPLVSLRSIYVCDYAYRPYSAPGAHTVTGGERERRIWAPGNPVSLPHILRTETFGCESTHIRNGVCNTREAKRSSQRNIIPLSASFKVLALPCLAPKNSRTRRVGVPW